MSPVVRAVLLTVLYWPVALFFVALSLLPECFVDVAPCEAAKRTVAITIFASEVALYAVLLFRIFHGRDGT